MNIDDATYNTMKALAETGAKYKRERDGLQAEVERLRADLVAVRALNEDLNAERNRLRAENAELRLAAQVELAEGDQVLAELEWFKARELKVDRLLNACKRWSNVTTADCLVELHAAVAEFKSANGAKPGAGT